jgi:hypothetical protein
MQFSLAPSGYHQVDLIDPSDTQRGPLLPVVISAVRTPADEKNLFAI